MNRRWTVLIFTSSLLGCAPQQQPAPRCAVEAAPGTQGQDAAGAQSSESEIREIISHQSEAWDRHDAKAWVAPFSEDADFINILGMKFAGRAEIERRHDDIFKTIFARSRVVVTTERVRFLSPSVAIAETEHALRDYDRLPPGIQPTDADGTLRTRMRYVWERKAEGWRIVAAQNTAIFALPTPPRP
jgi:uncharacterized protein (TIGR02246 family)